MGIWYPTLGRKLLNQGEGTNYKANGFPTNHIPIVEFTNNPNDPRIKLYEDELERYEKTKGKEKQRLELQNKKIKHYLTVGTGNIDLKYYGSSDAGFISNSSMTTKYGRNGYMYVVILNKDNGTLLWSIYNPWPFFVEVPKVVYLKKQGIPVYLIHQIYDSKVKLKFEGEGHEDWYFKFNNVAYEFVGIKPAEKRNLFIPVESPKIEDYRYDLSAPNNAVKQKAADLISRKNLESTSYRNNNNRPALRGYPVFDQTSKWIGIKVGSGQNDEYLPVNSNRLMYYIYSDNQNWANKYAQTSKKSKVESLITNVGERSVKESTKAIGSSITGKLN